MTKEYKFHQYDYKDRWISYWHQIDEVLKLRPKEILEIGIGNKLVSSYLRKQGIVVKTLDIDKELTPDFIGGVENIPLKNNSVDLVLCAEVLEHLPFDKFEQCLKELRRVTKGFIVFSLPHFGPPIKISFKVPYLKEVKVALKVPYHPRHVFSGEHYWEIGKKNYSSRKIKKIISKYFKVRKEFIPFENQYHHFYILEK